MSWLRVTAPPILIGLTIASVASVLSHTPSVAQSPCSTVFLHPNTHWPRRQITPCAQLPRTNPSIQPSQLCAPRKHANQRSSQVGPSGPSFEPPSFPVKKNTYGSVVNRYVCIYRPFPGSEFLQGPQLPLPSFRLVCFIAIIHKLHQECAIANPGGHSFYFLICTIAVIAVTNSCAPKA
ncbi:hypothetical protein F4806DRAFT_4579 [Annulohypoxylon nitens]|nr:hypothetical protein F4806DRAFT_4579 [Annulohypoxylon nitens]